MALTRRALRILEHYDGGCARREHSSGVRPAPDRFVFIDFASFGADGDAQLPIRTVEKVEVLPPVRFAIVRQIPNVAYGPIGIVPPDAACIFPSSRSWGRQNDRPVFLHAALREQTASIRVIDPKGGPTTIVFDVHTHARNAVAELGAAKLIGEPCQVLDDRAAVQLRFNSVESDELRSGRVEDLPLAEPEVELVVRSVIARACWR
jgi:hypothetical protein